MISPALAALLAEDEETTTLTALKRAQSRTLLKEITRARSLATAYLRAHPVNSLHSMQVPLDGRRRRTPRPLILASTIYYERQVIVCDKARLALVRALVLPASWQDLIAPQDMQELKILWSEVLTLRSEPDLNALIERRPR